MLHAAAGQNVRNDLTGIGNDGFDPGSHVESALRSCYADLTRAVCAHAVYRSLSVAALLCQTMHDHGAGYRCGRSGEQGRQVLLDPREAASVRLLGTRIIVEDADRRHGVVWCIDYVVGPNPTASLIMSR